MTSLRTKRVDVTFSPPTPNGDFHLGHLAGPVLASDIYARSQRMLGHDVTFACSTDDNQTYVVTTARRLGTTPEALIGEALRSMSRTLALARVELDLFDRPDDVYRTFVQTFFDVLWSRGAFDRATVHLPYDEATGEYQAEAFMTGHCPRCLAHARAGVCETCGFYNLPDSLISDATDNLPRRPVSVWVLDFERHRRLIEDWYSRFENALRPDLQAVIATALSDRLPYLPITYPGDWGIEVQWNGPGAPPQVLNAWPEIFVGHVYWLSRARGTSSLDCDELVQFIGIDNGFYNAFCYVTLGLLAEQAGLPLRFPSVRTITNQYLLLRGRKFSTSKGDVVWAGDFLTRQGADRARFVLALKSPELQQSEFTDEVVEQTLADRFDRPLAVIRDMFDTHLVGRQADTEPSERWSTALRASVRQFSAAFETECFSIRSAAEALARHLELLAAAGDPQGPDDVAGRLRFLWALRSLAWPVTPGLAEAVATAFGVPPGPGAPHLTEALEAPSGAFRGLSLAGLDALERASAT